MMNLMVDVEINGKELMLSYCNTCNVRRPPRTFHCSRCDACVEVHDHHCPWVGTCIGKRNHKFFTSFIFFSSLHAGFSFGVGVYTLVKGLNFIASDGYPALINFPCWIITVYAAMMVFVLLPFSFYHLWLMS